MWFLSLGLLTDAVVNHPYLISYFDIFSLGGFRVFDYFILVNWHHLLLRKQDKQHTVKLAWSMFIIHVPFLCQFFHISARRSLLVSLRLLGESANVFGISAAFAIVEMSRGGVTG